VENSRGRKGLGKKKEGKGKKHQKAGECRNAKKPGEGGDLRVLRKKGGKNHKTKGAEVDRKQKDGNGVSHPRRGRKKKSWESNSGDLSTVGGPLAHGMLVQRKGGHAKVGENITG